MKKVIINKIPYYLIVAFCFIFLASPLIVAVLTSFSPGVLTFPPKALSLRWWNVLFNRPEFIEALRMSIVIALYATVISLIVGFLCAIALVRYHIKGKDLLQSFLTLPLVIPGVVIGASLVYYFAAIGVIDSFPKLLAAHVLSASPYTLRTISATLIGFDRTLEEAAMNLGADVIQTLRKITLPIIKPGLIAAAIFAFATSFNELTCSVFLTSVNVFTLPVLLFSWTTHQMDPTIASASAFIFLITLSLIVITEKLLGINNWIGRAGIR